MARVSFKLATLVFGALLAGVVLAQGAKVSSPVELARRADALKPGQWVWAPRIAPSGPVLVYVDLSRQVATIYRNGVRIGVSTVSTGKPGHATPTGVFTILEKNVEHHSNAYNNASMPYQQRLTWDGVALHAGGLPGYPESHGCVHLPYAFARELFDATRRGTTVVVTGDASHAVTTDSADVLAPSAVVGEQAGEFWAPERAASGPVTIVISRSDQAVVVLRNGVEIGRARAALPADSDATHVLTLGTDATGAPAWFYVGVAGHANESGRPVDEAVRNRVQVAPDFYAKVAPLLLPGTTLLVTAEPLSQGDAGTPLTVLNGREDAPRSGSR
ncbi:L,D-transpeptidase family protein [Duganella sp. Leaf61]|uniref:L,D-transpeptidase family protein n=1 Tax=Duganella sp. Leaf61 TaxID=1736227 RepID=UPI000ABA4B43|nr:L,D-transpeptidase family protein [Duganella sp. Leaf61]